MLTFKQSLKPITQSDVDRAAHLVYVVRPNERLEQDAVCYADVLKQRAKRFHVSHFAKETLFCDLPNEIGTRVSVAAFTPQLSEFELLTKVRKLLAKHLDAQPKELVIAFVGVDTEQQARYTEAFAACLLAATLKLPDFKSKTKDDVALKQVSFYGLAKRVDLSRAQAIGQGNNLARRLTSLPSNKLSPALYIKEIQQLAKAHHWQFNILDIKALQQKKAGAFLAVAQGSDNNEAGIVHLRYEPAHAKKKTTRRIALVGKGICYDTGGTNLKPSKSMFGMHEDMEGSAVALGTLLALSELKVDFTVDCWLAITNNMIGPLAYKQNDVITALNGTTIEIVHTDAEGRMVLADTLSLACDAYPELIIDYATLTGSCIAALGTRYSGATTNRDEFIASIIEAGRASGERVWPFPFDEDFDEELESQVADVKQCTLGNEADHILGARFLNRFVNNIPWVHVDLSSGNNKGGLGFVPTDITGVGVRFTLNLLLQQNLLSKI